MIELEREIETYDSIRADLENSHMGQWAVVFGQKLVGTYASFGEAAQIAVRNYGRGPYLIRQVGAPPIAMPASVVFNVQQHA